MGQFKQCESLIKEHVDKLQTDCPNLEKILTRTNEDERKTTPIYFDNILTKKIVNQKNEILKKHDPYSNDELMAPTQKNDKTQGPSIQFYRPPEDLNNIQPKINIDSNSLNLLSDMFNNVAHDIKTSLEKRAFKESKSHEIKKVILHDVLQEAVEKYCK